MPFKPAPPVAGAAVASFNGRSGAVLLAKADVTDTGLAAADVAAAQGLTPTPVKTAAYTAAAGDFVPVDISGGSVPVTLPSAPADKTRIGVKVVKVSGTPGSTSCTIPAAGTDVFNITAGSVVLTLTSLFQGVLLQYKASAGIWYVSTVDTPLGVPLGAAKLGTDGTVGGPSGSALTGSVVKDPLGVSVPLQDVAGNQLVNVPTFQANTLYPAGYCIQQGGLIYARVAPGTSGASFAADAANWTPVSSAELGYAQITSNVALTTSLTTIAGLTVTVTVASRPIKLVLDIQACQISAVGNSCILQFFEGGTNLASVQYGVGAANGLYPVHRELRLAPTPGSHTYAVQAQLSGSAGANDRLLASANSPAFLQAMQI